MIKLRAIGRTPRTDVRRVNEEAVSDAPGASVAPDPPGVSDVVTADPFIELLNPGTAVADYVVDDVLERTEGVVTRYRARYRFGERPVLLDVIPPLGVGAAREDAERRARALARIEEPGLAPVLDLTHFEQGLVVAWQAPVAETLEQVMARGTLTRPDVLDVLAPVAAALDALHSRGLAHGDLGADRILVTGQEAEAGAVSSLLVPPPLGSEVGSVGDDVSRFRSLVGTSLSAAEDAGRPLPLALRRLLQASGTEHPAAPGSASALLATVASALDQELPPSRDASEPSPRPDVAVHEGRLAPSRPVRQQARRSPLRMLAIGAGLLALVATGYVTGDRSTASDGREGALAPDAVGALQLTTPASWNRLSELPAIPGFSPRNPVGFAPAGFTGSAALVAGQIEPNSSTLLPRKLLERVEGPPPQREAIQLGRYQAFRYRRLSISGFDGRVTMYSIPTSAGAATIACAASNELAGVFLPQCERVAASLSLEGLETFPVRPSPKYARTVNRVVQELDRARIARRARLRRARTARGQAEVAGSLASAYAAAAQRLRAAAPAPPARQANQALIAALAETRQAYQALGTAARRGDRRRYDAAREATRTDEIGVRRALRALRAIGYEVG